MKKFLLIGATALMVSNSTFAGGILTNTNQNAAYLRNPARDAVIAIDGVYSNPAGIAFLPQGFHLSVSWQAAFQKRQIDATGKMFMMNANNQSADRYFEGTAKAPVIPSFQAAYVINDKWSVSGQFAIGGGGGKCEFDNGLPMFEEMIGGAVAQNGGTSYALNQQLTGKQYFFGLQLGATYRLAENFSVFGGVRGVLASCGYEGAINGIKANGLTAAEYSALSQQAAAGAQQAADAAAQFAAAGLADKAAEYAAMAETLKGQAVQAGTVAAMIGDYNLDCSQSGFGITPIIGLDWNLGKLNLAAKYEFRTKIELENESTNSANVDALMPAYADGGKVRSDIPALLTLGAQYQFTDAFRAMAGFHYYWDKDAQGSPIKKGNNTWEALLGFEWDVNDKIMLSMGGQRTDYNFDDADMSDINFNTPNYAVCLGGAYKFSEKMKLNVGYMHSFYEDHKTTSAASGITRNYTRKNDVVGVSLDIAF
ncbi:MAG: outer membrane beta-barrel protein [Bacteroides sp.]|nr:outer membrane beta-barrel protein [Bacteroides sp.]